MGFRQKYIKATGIKINSDIHIHHIDRDRSNNDISNLIHLTRLSHIRYHHLINCVSNIIKTLHINNDSIYDLENDDWTRRSMIYFNIMDGWEIKLFNIEKRMIRSMNIRNSKTGITTINTFINDDERRIINIFLNDK